MRRFLPTICSVTLTLFVATVVVIAQAPTESTKKPRRRPPIERERMKNDKPAEAADFAVRKRTTGIITRAPSTQAQGANRRPAALAARAPAPPMPVEKYQAAIARMRDMWSHSTESNRVGRDADALGKWRELGPSNIGGRTRQLLFHPRKPHIMYVAAVAGGVWKTKNSGRSWEQLTDLLIPNIAVNSLAIDPRDSDILYAGTGEGYFNIDAVRGAGIFKTVNGGKRWSRLASTAGPDFDRVNDIVISPRNTRRVYATTRTGIWRSTNGGSTWTRMLELHPVLDPDGCFDLAVQPGRQGYIFATCGSFRFGPRSGIYRMLDNSGATGFDHVYTEIDIARISLAIAPSNPEVIYALAADMDPGTFENRNLYQHGLRGVFRSTQNGAIGTWTTQVRNTDANKLNTLLLTNPVYAFLSDCGFGQTQFFNQGWYDNVIAVDPKDPNRVWAGGIDLFRSDDGGRNWGLASYWWFSGGVDGTSFDPNYAHADQHVIAFHPKYNGTTNKTMFVTNDGGIYRTDDARANVGTSLESVCGQPPPGAVTWRTLNNGYGVTQFYHGTVYPDGDTFFGGTQDNGTIRGSLATRDTWHEIQGGDGGYVAVDPTNPNTLFAEFTGLSITKSIDGGETFTDAVSGIVNDPGFAFIAPFHMSASNPQQLLTGGWYIWMTANQATSWNRVSALTPGGGSMSAAAISPVDDKRAVVGMSDGYLLFTHALDTANATTEWFASIPRDGYVSWVQWDPQDPNIVYATYATFNTAAGQFHVYRSTNGGRTWAGLDGSGNTGIPDLPVHTLIVDPSNTSRLYIGTDAGVFTSVDGGRRWFKEVTGFANVVTEALALNPDGKTRLYAFTHGRSAWRVNLKRDRSDDNNR